MFDGDWDRNHVSNVKVLVSSPWKFVKDRNSPLPKNDKAFPAAPAMSAVWEGRKKARNKINIQLRCQIILYCHYNKNCRRICSQLPVCRQASVAFFMVRSFLNNRCRSRNNLFNTMFINFGFPLTLIRLNSHWYLFSFLFVLFARLPLSGVFHFPSYLSEFLEMKFCVFLFVSLCVLILLFSEFLFQSNEQTI